MSEKRLVYLDVNTARKVVDQYRADRPIEFPVYAVQDASGSRIPAALLLTKTQANSIDAAQKKLKSLQKKSNKIKFSAEQSRSNIGAKAKLALELAQISDSGMRSFIKSSASELKPELDKLFKNAGEKPPTLEEIKKMLSKMIEKVEKAGKEELKEEEKKKGKKVKTTGEEKEIPVFSSNKGPTIFEVIPGFENLPEEAQQQLMELEPGELKHLISTGLKDEIKDASDAADALEDAAEDIDDQEIKDNILDTVNELEQYVSDLSEDQKKLKQLELPEKEFNDDSSMAQESSEDFSLLEDSESLESASSSEVLLGKGLFQSIRGGGIPMRLKMSKTQVRKNQGGGFWSDLGKSLTSFAAGVVDTFLPGVGTAGKTLVDEGIDALDKALRKGGAMNGQKKQNPKLAKTHKKIKKIKQRRKERLRDPIKGGAARMVNNMLSNPSFAVSKRQKLRTKRGGEITRASRVLPFSSVARQRIGGAPKAQKKKAPKAPGRDLRQMAGLQRRYL